MTPTLRLAAFGCFLSLCALWYWPGGHTACAGSAESQGCKVAAEALDAASKLRVGMRRAEIEKDFELDGGMTFQDKATYTFRSCHYIKVEVEFQKGEASNVGAISPDDQASRISRPYLGYPVSD